MPPRKQISTNNEQEPAQKAVAMNSQGNEVPNDAKFNLLGVDGWVQIDKWHTWSLLVVHDNNNATDFWHY